MLPNKGAGIYTEHHNNHMSLDTAIQNGKTNVASLLITKGALVEADLNSLLDLAINNNNETIVKMIVDYGINNNPSMNLIIHLKTAISKRNLTMIEAIIPHCGFFKPSDLYIPKELVVNSNLKCKNCVKLLLKWGFTINLNRYDENLIYEAVENGQLPIIVNLLEYGINVNLMNTKTGLNLLTIACLNEHHKIVEKLLEHNADVNVKISSEKFNKILNHCTYFSRNIFRFRELFLFNNDKHNLTDLTCLHIAVLNCDLITTDILLKYGAKIEDDAELFNLICVAIKNDCEKIVGKLLNHSVNVINLNSYGKTLLNLCLNYCSTKKDSSYNIVKMLLEKGAHVHLQTPDNSLVFQAITFQHRKIAQLFLNYKADVQYISPNGDTCLHRAIKNKFDAKFIKTLLKLNSPVNVVNSAGSTPLLDACKIRSADQFKIIQVLLHYDADVNCADKHMMTPLHLACRNENLEMVEVFLEKLANPNAMNNQQKTPLHYTCESECGTVVKIIELLVEHGANTEAVDAKRLTPLFLAYKNKNYGAVKCLLDYYANPNHTNSENLTLLHIAIKEASSESSTATKTHLPIQLLIKYGANIDVLDGENRTPLYAAVEDVIIHSNDDYLFRKNYGKIIKILVSQGIKLQTAGIKVKNHNSDVVFSPDKYITIDRVKYLANDILEFNVVPYCKDVVDRYDEVSDDEGSNDEGSNDEACNDEASNDEGSDDEDSTNMFFIDEDSIGDIRQLKASCEREIRRIKKKKIGIDHLTFYDLLEANIYRLRRFFKNEKIQERLETGVYDDKFPLYIDIIKSRLRDATIRYEHYMLRIPARDYFRFKIYHRLPDECLDEVFIYLNVGELKIFIEAMEQSDE